MSNVVHLHDRRNRPRPEGIQRMSCGCRVPFYLDTHGMRGSVALVRESYAVDHARTCAIHPDNWPASWAQEVYG